MLHLRARLPLEGIPRLCGSSGLDVGAPDALGPVNVPREPTREKAAIHRRAHELVVALRAAFRTVFVAAVLSARVEVAGVVGFAVERGMRMRIAVDLSKVPVVFVLAPVADLV